MKRSVAGRFVKGVSGNPGGRPREIGDLRELAKSYTEAAVRTLANIMNDEEAPPAARTAAASALLDRGYGRPAQSIDTRIDVAVNVAESHAEALMELSRRAREAKAKQSILDVTPAAIEHSNG